MNTGLVSITFRKLSPGEIIKLVAKAGLDGIEWGGDIHVPHGDIIRAKEVSKMTIDSGLKAAAYGSYYYVGCEEQQGIPFEKVLETALELKAPTIRVWAGNRGSAEADDAWWAKVIDETYRISKLAKNSGTTISFEYHGNTLTDTGEAALRLMKAVGGANTTCYWQPPCGLGFEQKTEGLKQILPWLGNIHVFWWNVYDRLPLADGSNIWKGYTEIIRTIVGCRYCMLEFVKNDDPDQFLKDAITLKEITA